MTWPPHEPRRGAAGRRPPDRWPSERDGWPGAGRSRGPRYSDGGYGTPGYRDYGTPEYGAPDYPDYGAPHRSDPGTPPPARGPRSSPGRRTVFAIVASISLIVFVVTTAGWAALRYYDGKVRHIPLAFADGATRPDRAGGGVKNILLVGSDSRAGTEGEFGEAAGQRSDTTMLAHVGADGSTALVSFPRDLWVEIPAYDDPAGTRHDPQEAKLNAAFAFGGPSLLVQTIEQLIDIRVDHYVEVDFAGFQAMTDALGGVTVCVKPLPPELAARGLNNLEDRFSGWRGMVGYNRLDGEQALAFVRQRYGLPEGDIDRIRRQQQFLGAMFREAASAETLTNPFDVAALLNAATSTLTVDEDTSLADLQKLAVGLQGVGTGGVRFQTVPASPQTIGGQSALVTDPAELDRFLAELTGQEPQASAGLPTAAIRVGSGDTGPSGDTGRPGGSAAGVARVQVAAASLAAPGALSVAQQPGTADRDPAADPSCTY